MGVLAPWFLAGLVGLALPLYLHLLKRQTTLPKPVSSLMFFESRTQASTRHRRLRYFLLLSLRLLVLLLLILAFANPFINRNTATLASGLSSPCRYKFQASLTADRQSSRAPEHYHWRPCRLQGRLR